MEIRIALFLLGYLGAVAGAELVTAFTGHLWGTVFHFAILIFLIVNSVVSYEYRPRGILLTREGPILALRISSPDEARIPGKLFLALGIAPLIRILSLSMPLTEFTLPYRYLIISIPMLVGIIAVARALHLRPRDMGLTVRSIRVQAMVMLTGIGLGAIDYVILRPDPFVSALTWKEFMVPALILLVATGFVEELAFRGLMQRSAQALGSWGWIYIAVVFSLLQIGQLSVQHGVFALSVGLFFGWVVNRTGSILGVSLCHGVLNIGLYLVFPFLY